MGLSSRAARLGSQSSRTGDLQTYNPRPSRKAKPSVKASRSPTKMSPTSAPLTTGASSAIVSPIRRAPSMRSLFTGTLSFKVSSQSCQFPEQKAVLHDNISLGSRLVPIKTREIEPQNLNFLKDIDLSTFPRCNYCFRKRFKCDGNRPCYSCWKRRACCKEITVVALKESPES